MWKNILVASKKVGIYISPEMIRETSGNVISWFERENPVSADWFAQGITCDFTSLHLSVAESILYKFCSESCLVTHLTIHCGPIHAVLSNCVTFCSEWHDQDEKNAPRRRKHCVLAVVRRIQKFSPRRRPPSPGRRTAKILSAGDGHYLYLQTQFGEDWYTQFRVIVVTDPPTNTHKQTGPISIHCAIASAQCNERWSVIVTGSDQTVKLLKLTLALLSSLLHLRLIARVGNNDETNLRTTWMHAYHKEIA